MAPHSSTLAWRIPWMEEPGGLQSMGSLRVGHDWAASLSCIGEGNGNPLQYSCLENPRDRGACWAAIYGVAQSWIWLTWLSSSHSLLQEIFPTQRLNPCLLHYRQIIYHLSHQESSSIHRCVHFSIHSELPCFRDCDLFHLIAYHWAWYVPQTGHSILLLIQYLRNGCF